MNLYRLISHIPGPTDTDGFYLEPKVVSNRTLLAMTTPHGYLQFSGQRPRVWLLNLHMWVYYKLPWTWKHD